MAGFEGSALRSAKATVPFLARFTGHGVDAASAAPVIDKAKVWVSKPEALLAVIWILNFPDLVGIPEITPVVVFTTKPAGSGVAL